MSAIVGRADPNLVKKGLFEDLQVTGALTVNKLRFFTDTTLQVFKLPTNSYDLVNKEYFDTTTAANFITCAGSICQKGGLTAPTAPNASEIAVWTGEPRKIKAVGGAKLTDTGALTVTQVSAKTVSSTDFTRLANTTLSGETTVSGPLLIHDPIDDPRAATNKRYVDQFLTTGIYPKASVKATSTHPIHPYAEYMENDTIIVPTTDPLTVDSVPLTIGDRVLLKNEINPAYNGVYSITEQSGRRSIVLKRTSDAWYDSLIMKSAYYIETGKTNAKTIWVCLNAFLTVGIDPIVYTQFASIGTPSFVNAGAGAGRIHSKSIGSEVHLRNVGANSGKIVVTENRTDINLDVCESEINVNNLSGIAAVSKGGTGMTAIPTGHFLVGGDRDVLHTVKPPKGDIVGTEEKQFLTGKTFDQISFVGRADFVTTVLPSSDFSENVTLWLPPTSDTLVGESARQTLSNKTIGEDNTVTATYLKSNAPRGSPIEVACYSQPLPGQVLTMVTPNKAVWKFPQQPVATNTRNNPTPHPDNTPPSSLSSTQQSPYMTTFPVTFSYGKWVPITRNTRGAGQIIFSSDSTDSAPQFVVTVAKTDSTKSEYVMNPLCEIGGTISIRWKSGKGLEAKCKTKEDIEYSVTVIGMVAAI